MVGEAARAAAHRLQYGQGFALARPLTESDVLPWLSGQRMIAAV